MNLFLWSQADLAVRAVNKAEEIGGSVRVICRSDEGHCNSTVLRAVDSNGAVSVEDIMDTLSGFVQARLISRTRVVTVAA